MSIHEAASRRDFTVNSIAADPMTGEIFDEFGGIEDLKNRTLRVTNAKKFQEDALRVYRGAQFSARLGFTLESETSRLMREMVEDGALDHLSKERVSDELKKLLLKSPRPSVGFERLRELGIIERDYPELHALINCPQEPEWHPEGDVWTHTMMVVDQAARITREAKMDDDERLAVLLGALCHDLGKPSTTAMGEKDGIKRIRSLGHEEAGKEPAEHLLERWMFGDEIKNAVIAITTQHIKPNTLLLEFKKGSLEEKSYANAIRKLIKKMHPTSWRVFLAACEADHRGRDLPGVATEPYEPGIFFASIVAKYQLDQEPTKPLVQGRDLIQRGLKPGKKFSELIKAIEAARDNGEIQTREEALELLDKLLQPQVA